MSLIRTAAMLLGAACLNFLIISTGFSEHAYVGVKKCGMCHKSKAKGNQLGQWKATSHATAYQTLTSEKALAKAKELGIEDPVASDQCAPCHITGFGVDAKLLAKTYKAEDGVGCESCHGPGKDYQKLKIMKDRALSVEAGLIIPDEKLCITCHNPDNPFHKEFVFKEFWAKIKHPNPKNK